MSKNINFKFEVNEILSKSQKNLLQRIESYRLQIKEVRERELAKSLIPVHNHKPGTTVGAGTEDVPYGKLNPKGVDKSEKCMKCGDMHKPLDKCGMMKALDNSPKQPSEPGPSDSAPADNKCEKCGAHSMSGLCDKCWDKLTPQKKSELVDEKGNRKSNSVNTPHPEPKKQTGDKGGVRLPGAGLKKAMTASMGSGVPSTKVNDLGKAAPKAKAPSVAMAGNTGNAKNKMPIKESNGGVAKPKVMNASPDIERKSEPPMAKPPSGKNMGTAVPTSTTKKSDAALAKDMFGGSKFGNKLAPGATPAPGHGFGASGYQVTQPIPKVKLPGAHLARVGPNAPTPAGASEVTSLTGGAKTAPSAPKALKSELEKAVPSMVGQMKGAGNTQLTSPNNMGRANATASALAGDFQPKGPINSGLELASKPGAMRASGSLGLASPKAAGVTPQAPAMAKPQAPLAAAPVAKPGIFGKISGFRKP